MKALYRKHRPTKLSEVVGQKRVTDALTGALEQGKIFHAYLFTGPRGTGKTSVARIFAHEVNGFNYEIEDNYVDIVEIDGASNRGIDDIRELREKASIAPTSGKYKVYIIDEVHMLTKEAFNALLKTLEEPPKHVIFIMATTDAHKVPVTITSRAQVYNFQLADFDTIFNHLKNIAKLEKINIEDDALKLIVKRGGGSFRDSLSLLDQISTLTDKEIAKDAVVAAMGLPTDEKVTEILSAYLEGNVVKITTLVKEVWVSGVKSETLTEEIITQIIENPRQELFTLLEKLTEIKAPFADAKLLVALTASAAGVADVSSGSPSDISFRKTTFSPSASYTGTPAEPPASQANLSGASEIYASGQKNLESLPNKIHSDGLNTSFNWDEFVEKVKQINNAASLQLTKSDYKFESGVLEIYPPRKIIKNILQNNKEALIRAAGEVRVIINEVGENKLKDETLTKISDIMGGEVKNDGGENPF